MRAQVDLIVCFDASASPIRNIQRIGRTGRHKAGRVIYILSQGREVDNYYKNKEVAVSRAAASACLLSLTQHQIANHIKGGVQVLL